MHIEKSMYPLPLLTSDNQKAGNLIQFPKTINKEESSMPKTRTSKYDKIIEDFLDNKAKFETVPLGKQPAWYVWSQLSKRIVFRGLGHRLSATVYGNGVLLENLEVHTLFIRPVKNEEAHDSGN